MKEPRYTTLETSALTCSFCANFGPPAKDSGRDQAGGWVSGWLHDNSLGGDEKRFAYCANQVAWVRREQDMAKPA